MKEIWKVIPTYKNYEVSNLGRVRSLKNNHGLPRISPLVLKALSPPTSIYLLVNLYKNHKAKTIGIHRLVLEAFSGKCPKGYQGAHLDNDPHNNKLTNLKWTTVKENNSHKKVHGTWQCGEKHGNHKYREKQILKIIKYINLGWKQGEISKKVGVPKTLVKDVRLKRAWRYLIDNSHKI